MKPFFLYLLAAYIALTVQAVFFKGIKPDIVLIIVCSYALKYGRTNGVAFGTVAGLLIDTANGFLMGPHILGKSLAAFFLNTIKGNLFQWNIYFNTLVLTLFSLMNILLVYVCLEFFPDISFMNRSIVMSAKEIIYTVLASLALYPVFKPVKEGYGD